MIPSLKLLSKVCFPFLGYSLLPNINCHNCRRTNGPVRKTTRSGQHPGTKRDRSVALKPPLPGGGPDSAGAEPAPSTGAGLRSRPGSRGTALCSPSATPRSPRVKKPQKPYWGSVCYPAWGSDPFYQRGLGDLLCFSSFTAVQ